MREDARIAYFISPHGFGHAARACAVIASLHNLLPNLKFEILTTVPEYFFKEALDFNFEYRLFQSDVGVVQANALSEDLPATVSQLEQFLPLDGERAVQLGKSLKQAQVDLIICDIAPVGLAAAACAGIPSVLIENFTWDWIYEGYLNQEPGFKAIIPPFQNAFKLADMHIQTRPFCQLFAGTLSSNPVARQPKKSKEEIRSQLEIDSSKPLVLVTMGGIRQLITGLSSLNDHTEATFLIPGGSEKVERISNVILLPHHSQYYHPDLVHASDILVGKLGYSTVSEAYHARIPYGYIPRDHFRETGPMGDFVRHEMGGLPIAVGDFYSGEWVKYLPALLEPKTKRQPVENGADQIAKWVCGRFFRPVL